MLIFSALCLHLLKNKLNFSLKHVKTTAENRGKNGGKKKTVVKQRRVVTLIVTTKYHFSSNANTSGYKVVLCIVAKAIAHILLGPKSCARYDYY